MRAFGSAMSAVVLSVLMLVPLGSSSAQEPVRIEDNIVVFSSDGTPIVATLMLPGNASADRRVPAILMTHGWGGTRSRRPDSLTGRLIESGYALLTWDSRGFGQSGGEANIGAPGFEVRDANALIDYLATRDEIVQDGPNDPRVGWIGGSNAGGVQLNAAALDRKRRIEAIVPVVPWGNLTRDLIPNGVAKITWDEALYFTGAVGAATGGLTSPAGVQTGNYARQIHVAANQLHATGQISDDIRAWFSRRSTTARAHRIRTPTLIVQGSIDTLFPLEDAFDLYREISASGTPVKMIAFCGGHTLAGCTYPGGESGYPKASAERTPIWVERAADWLDRYVKGRAVATGPDIEYQANDGFYYGAPDFPLIGTDRILSKALEATLHGPGPGGGDGPADGNPAPAGELGASAYRARILAPSDEERAVVGVPVVDLEATVTGLNAHLFFEVIDVAPDGSRVTVNDQVMPLELGMGTSRHRVPLHGIAWLVKPGHSLELEVTTGSTAYEVSRFGPYDVSFTARTRLPATTAERAMNKTLRA